MGYIESKDAKRRMNDVLVAAMRDNVIENWEAKLIVEELNRLQEVTREECIKLLRKHGHTRVAEQYNKLVYDGVLYTGPKRSADSHLLDVGTRSDQRTGKATAAKTRLRPKTKQRLVWLAITGPAALAALVYLIAQFAR